MINRTSAFSRLTPLPPSKPPQPPPELPPDPQDSVHHSSALKIGAGVMLGLSVVGIAGGLVAPRAPQSLVQMQSPPSQTWFTTTQEEDLGKTVATALEKTYPVWNNAEAQERLVRIGNRLEATSTRHDIQFSYKLLDTKMVNAMALPGGRVYATRALMENTPDDDQLTFILGHEMAHVEQRHSVQTLKHTLLQAVLTSPLRLRQFPLARMAMEEGDKLVHNRYSQPMESEADRLGQEHIARIGIDPMKAVEALEHLETLLPAGQKMPASLEKIFSDHPSTPERIANLRTWAGKL